MPRTRKARHPDPAPLRLVEFFSSTSAPGAQPYLPVPTGTYLPTYLPIYLPTYLPTYLSIYLSTYTYQGVWYPRHFTTVAQLYKSALPMFNCSTYLYLPTYTCLPTYTYLPAYLQYCTYIPPYLAKEGRKEGRGEARQLITIYICTLHPLV